jgi:hypothetical protein
MFVPRFAHFVAPMNIAQCGKGCSQGIAKCNRSVSPPLMCGGGHGQVLVLLSHKNPT